MCVTRDTGKVGKDNDMRTNNPYIRRCDRPVSIGGSGGQGPAEMPGAG